MILRALIAFVSLTAIASADYGDNIFWRYSFGLCYDKFSNAPDNICRKEYQALILHTNPYRIDGLNWDYVAASAGKGRWGVIGSIRSYSLEDLYNDIKLSGGGAVEAVNRLYFSLETELEREKFGTSGAYNQVSLLAQAQYLVRGVSLSTGLGKIPLLNPYRNSRKVAMPFLNISIGGTRYYRLSAGLRQTERRRGSWYFCHEIIISDNFSFDWAGLSYPNSLQCGLDFSWKKIKFNIIYQGIDKLDDNVIWGISTRK